MIRAELDSKAIAVARRLLEAGVLCSGRNLKHFRVNRVFPAAQEDTGGRPAVAHPCQGWSSYSSKVNPMAARRSDRYFG